MLVYNTLDCCEPERSATPAQRDKCLRWMVETYMTDHALRARVLKEGRIPLTSYHMAGIPTGLAYRLEPATDLPALRQTFRDAGIRIEPQYVGTPKGAAHEKELQELYNLVKRESKRASAGS